MTTVSPGRPAGSRIGLGAMSMSVFSAPALDAAFVRIGGVLLAPDAGLVTVITAAWLLAALGLAWLVLERRRR